jgi:hypothetical protein
LNTDFAPDRTVILEGVLSLSEDGGSTPTGLYLEGSAEKSAALLVRGNGAVDYGTVGRDEAQFERDGHVDRDLRLDGSARFRLLRKGRMTEFYLNDVLMQCYCLPKCGTGRIGLLGSSTNFSRLAAWYCR